MSHLGDVHVSLHTEGQGLSLKSCHPQMVRNLTIPGGSSKQWGVGARELIPKLLIH